VTSPPAQSPLEQLLAERGELQTQLDQRCVRLVKALREKCPAAVPPPRPKPGAITDPVEVSNGDFEPLLRAALADGDGPFLLVEGDSELIVDPARTRVLTGEGLILVALGVACDQTGPAEITVPFGVGSQQADAGMIVTTEHAPRGPEVIVTRWGEALIALAWEGLMSVLSGLTRHAGPDLDVAPLIPAAVTATKGAVTVVPQARHDADRHKR